MPISAADTVTPPGDITSLAAAKSGQISLTWAAPGADGYDTADKASYYQIQYSSFTPFVWGDSRNTVWAVNRSVTGFAGAPETEMITSLRPETSYYFAIRAFDSTGNFGSSNLSTATASAFYSLWTATETGTVRCISVGDYDNDGLADVASGNAGADRIYKNMGNGAFVVVWNSAESETSGSVFWGDYDNDGDLDLACGNIINQVNRVYRNNGGGAFALIWTSSESEDTRSLAWGDYDNDGLLDLAAGNYAQVNRIYRNNGNNTFVSVWTSAETENTRSLIWGDYDNDGDLDLACANDLQTNRVYRNNGDGSFSPIWNSPDAEETYTMFWGDYDNDGDLDLSCANDGQTNRVYRNNGDNTFTSIWNSPETENSGNFTWGDYDNDGDLDLACGNAYHARRVYRNNGDATFSSIWSSPEIESSGSLFWIDADNDGDLDIINGSNDSNDKRLRLYRNMYAEYNTVNSTPVAPANLTEVYSSANHTVELRWDAGSDAETAVADGLYYEVRVGSDIAVPNGIVSGEYGSPLMGNHIRPKTGASQLGYSLNTARLRDGVTYYWSVRTIDTGLRKSSWTTTADFFIQDAPGDITTLTAVKSGQISLSWTAPAANGYNVNTGTASYYQLQYSTVSPFAWGDSRNTVWAVNRSVTGLCGKPETEMITGLKPETSYYFAIRTFDANGNYGISNISTATAGAFYSAWISTETENTSNIAWGDYDNDGDLDMVCANVNQYDRVYQNNGNGTFTSVWNTPDMLATFGCSWGDYNNDGYLDLALGHYSGSQPLKVYKNNGNSTFTNIWSGSNESIRETAWGDYDNDGDLDIACARYNLSNRVYRNNGDGTFSAVWDSADVSNHESLFWGDYDNDGDLDLASASTSEIPRVYRNDGDNIFSPVWSGTGGSWTFSWGDFDNDGDLDIAIGHNSAKRVYRNDGGSTFNQVWISPDTDFTGSAAWGDYNNDGYLDLLYANSSNYGKRVYRGNGDGTFSSMWVSPELDSNVFAVWGDYDNDGDLDFACANNGANRLYRNMYAEFSTINSTPVAPANLTEVYSSANHTVELRWTAGSDAETAVADGLYYEVRVGSDIAVPNGIVSGEYGSPLMGNHIRPKTGASQLGFSLNTARLRDGVTYYWSVRTIDTGLRKSSWTTTADFFIQDAPGDITSLTAAKSGQIRLSWIAPAANGYNVNTGTASYYQIQYSTVSPFAWGDSRNTVWAVNRSVTGLCGKPETEMITGLKPETSYYFAIRTFDANGNYGISNISTATAGAFYSVWSSTETVNSLSAAWGDYDNDGDLDITSGDSGYVSRIYRNNGNGTFISIWNTPQSKITASIAWGDYDNDGDLDLLLGNYSSDANYLYRNNGDGTFTSVWNTAETEETRSVDWGDYDNDGDLDIACGNSYQTNRVYRNNGNDTFTSVWNSVETDNTMCIAWGDYDNDGDLDLACGNGWQPNRVYRNNGDNTFSAIWNSAETEDTSSMTWGDYDNDGDLDLACGNDGQTNRVYRNNGDGTFSSIWNSAELEDTRSVVWGDYDNDGYLDLAAGNSGNQMDRVYRNNGNETFTAIWGGSKTEPTNCIVYGDYDNDGDLDLACIANGTNRVYRNMYAEYNTVNSTPVAPANLTEVYSSANHTIELRWDAGSDAETAVADGLYYEVRVGSDIAVPNGIVSGEYGSPLMGNHIRPKTGASQLGYSLNTARLRDGVTYYWSVRTIDTGLRKSSWTTTADFFIQDAPGDITTLTAAKSGQIRLSWTAPAANGYNVNTGTASYYQIQYSTVSPFAWGDSRNTVWAVNRSVTGLCGKAETEMITGLKPETSYYFAIRTFDANGNYGISNISTATAGAFYSAWNSAELEQTYSMAWGDYDNDGDQDLACGNSGQTNRVYRNNGDSTFTSIWNSAELESTTSVAWGDYDNDGDLDLACGNNGQTNRVYRNNGNDTFSSIWNSPETEQTYSIAWGDYDNDGDLDLACGNSNQTNRVYRNNGDNTFSSIWGSAELENTKSMAWGDYDNDGDLDLACGNADQTNRVYRNNGNDTFSSIWNSVETEGTKSVAWGDYDNDGDLDLSSSGGTSGQPNRIYRNDGNDTFVSVWSSPVGHDNFCLSFGDYDNDGDLDLACGVGSYLSKPNLVYRNNGNGTFTTIWSSPQSEVSNSVAWGDYDNDGDLDMACGNLGKSNSIYRNMYAEYNTVNSTPVAPANLTEVYSSANHTVELRWDAGSDAETTVADGLYYEVRVGSALAVPNGIVSGEYGSPLMGNHIRPKTGASQLGYSLNTARLRDGVTYYWSVRTIDTGLRKSSWTTTADFFIQDAPGDITTLTAAKSGQIRLSWIAPAANGYNVNTGTASYYQIQYSTYTPFVWGDSRNTVWAVNRSVTGLCGKQESEMITGLKPETSYYFAIRTFDANGNYGISNISTATAGAFYLLWNTEAIKNTESIVWGDYDNDGDLDFAVGNWGQPKQVYRNDSNATFPLVWSSAESEQIYYLAWGDCDNDGDLDLACANYNQAKRVYRNNGGDTFSSIWNSTEIESTTSIAWGDCDNDGDLDLFCGNLGHGNRVYRNNGNATFESVWQASVVEPSYEIALGDYDNDGYLDFVCGTQFGGNPIYRNNHDNTFSVIWDASSFDTKSMVWGDYDNDGDLDLACGNNGYNRVYRNDDGDNFVSVWVSQLNEGTIRVSWGDYDNDGDLDLACANAGNQTNRIYRNNGNETFSSIWNSPETDTSTSFAWGDYDNDGDIDLIAGNYGQVSRVYRNMYAEYNTVNSTPVAPGGLTASTSSYMHLFTWNAASDTESSAASLYYNVRVGTASGLNGEVSGKDSSPLMGNYLRPKVNGSQLGVKVSLTGETSYYWSVQTIDTGLRKSTWSAEQVCYFDIPPVGITNLTALAGNGSITLKWTAPGNDGPYNSNAGGKYTVKYTTSGAIDDETKFTNASLYVSTWTPITQGLYESQALTGLNEGTYYFSVKTQDAKGNLSVLSNSDAYAISAGSISLVAFATSSQTVVAGLQSAVMTLQLRDQYNNAVNAKNDTQINLGSTSGGADFSSDGAVWGVASLTIPTGSNSVNFYYKDTVTGYPLLTATPSGETWTPATQSVTITNDSANHFTVTYSGDVQVLASKSFIVTAYDQYNNIARDYTGTADFVCVTGSATITPSSHTFTSGDLGIYTVSVYDNRVESVQVKSTDRATPSITGTSSALWFNGTYVSGVYQIIASEVSQSQVDAPILRFDLKASSGTSALTRIKLDLTGSAVSADVARVNIYRDNGNGNFVPAEDVLIGSNTFSGGTTTVNVSTETLNSSLKIYYVAYDLASGATVDSTIGARINTISYFTFTSGLPMGINYIPVLSSTAAIIGTPRVVTVNPTDTPPAGNEVIQGQNNVSILRLEMFTDLGAVTWQQARVNKKGTCADADISRIGLWRDNNSDGLFQNNFDTFLSSGALSAGSVYLAVNDSIEISTKTYFFVADISPSAGTEVSFGLECTQNSYFTVNSPHLVSNATFPITSSTSTIKPTTDILTVTAQDKAPTDSIQGTTNVEMLKLTLSVNANGVIWTGLKLDRTGTATDSDISAIKVFYDSNADGIFQSTDTLVSNGNDLFISGSANLILASPQTILSGANKTYFVALNIAAGATLSNTVGLSLATSNYFVLSAPDYTASTNFPIANVTPTNITEYADTVVVVSSNAAPAGANQSETLSMLWLKMSTSYSNATLTNIRIDRFSSASDSDVKSVSIRRDLNGNGVNDVGDQTISSGNDVFSDNTVNIALTTQQTINTSTQTYFVVVVLSSSVPPASTLGVRLISKDYVTVNAPNVVSTSGFPHTSSLVTIAEPPSVVTVIPENLMPAAVSQGDTLVPVLKMVLQANQYNATLRSIRLNLSGTGAYSDISHVKIYKDNNANFSFDPASDLLISGGSDSFDATKIVTVTLTPSQTVTTSSCAYFAVYDISETASNSTVGATLSSEGYFTFDSPDAAGSANFPINSSLATINATVDTLAVTPVDAAPPSVIQADTNKPLIRMSLVTDNRQVVWTALRVKLGGTCSDGDIAGVKIYLDADADNTLIVSSDTLLSPSFGFAGGFADITLASPETLSTVSKTYFIAADISQTASAGATVGIVSSGTYFTVISPDLVAPVGFNSTPATVIEQPDTVTASRVNLAGSTVDQDKQNAPFLKLNMATDHDSAPMTSIRIYKTGTLSDALIKAVKIYYDADGNSTLDTAKDSLVSSGSDVFGSSQCVLALTAQLIGAASKGYFVALDIDANATVGATVGVRLLSSSYITITSPDTMSASNFPLESNLSTVRDIRTPLTPEVFDEGDYTYDFEHIRASWTSSVISGTITDSRFAVGTTSNTTDVVAWTTNGTEANISVNGLGLKNEKTYFVLVKAKSNYGLWSEVGVSDGITVDLVEPRVNSKPEIIKGRDTLVINFPAVTVGTSSITCYELQERQGVYPRWITVSTKTFDSPASTARKKALGIFAASQDLSVTFTNKAPSTYFYRVRALNGAGKWSEFSEAARVVFGLLSDNVISEVSNYPNPFDSRKETSVILYNLNQDTDVDLKIYSLFGSLVRSMHFASGAEGGWAGSNEIKWDGKDDNGSFVSHGGYIALITAKNKGNNNIVRHKIAVIH
ncbi:MAG: hypothetical protein A2339_04820 [Elusimicrobia bacterium RIFOXYB12_FULL_50_12]|nr:MAG: hypothetical protein A2339_04820 [Elusimicrobia bacterium RIFOXYB12_FULL_50_12]